MSEDTHESLVLEWVKAAKEDGVVLTYEQAESLLSDFTEVVKLVAEFE